MDPPSSGLKRPSLPPRSSSESSAKRAKLDLPEYQLITLNDRMNAISNDEFWPSILERATKNSEKLPQLLARVSQVLTRVLATTDAKATTREELTDSQADSFVQAFISEELKEWEAGLRKGVEKHDWKDLITHRTYNSSSDSRVAFEHSDSET